VGGGVPARAAAPYSYDETSAARRRRRGALDGLGRHPSQLYQALEGLVLFALLWWFSRAPRPRYAVSGLFALLYGVFRFAVEFVREPDAHLGYLAWGWLTMGQLLSLPLVALRPVPAVAVAARADAVAADLRGGGSNEGLSRPAANVLEHGTEKADRTGTGTRSVFGWQMRFDLAKGFPLVTTKKLHLRSIVHELLWFLRGDTNIASTCASTASASGTNGPTPTANSGPVYGRQWRAWAGADGGHRPDPLGARRDPPQPRFAPPDGGRPGTSPSFAKMALQPCHALFQFYVADGRLSCQLYQRSGDIFLGVPFNIASYALLTYMVAQVRARRRRFRAHARRRAPVQQPCRAGARAARARAAAAAAAALNPAVRDLFAFRFEDIESRATTRTRRSARRWRCERHRCLLVALRGRPQSGRSAAATPCRGTCPTT
jgi:thymidylate synthase